MTYGYTELFRSLCSASEKAKSWVTQRTTLGNGLGHTLQFWVVRWSRCRGWDKMTCFKCTWPFCKTYLGTFFVNSLVTHRTIRSGALSCSENLWVTHLATRWPLFKSTDLDSGNGLLPDITNYLNQCWLIISEMHWHSSEGNFMRSLSH